MAIYLFSNGPFNAFIVTRRKLLKDKKAYLVWRGLFFLKNRLLELTVVPEC